MTSLARRSGKMNLIYGNQGVPIPEGFDGTVPFTIKNSGGSFSAPGLDLSVYAASIPTDAVYVDGATGSDSNDGSSSNPLKSLNKAINSFTENTIYVKPGTYYRNVVSGKGGAFKGVTVTRSLRVIPWPGESGYIYLTSAEGGLSWASDPTYTNCYTATRSVTGNVVDLTNLDSDGVPTPLTKQTSETNTNNNANSWYIDGANKVFVRTFDDREPDDDILVIVSETNAKFQEANTFYFEKCRFIGGNLVGYVNIDTDSTQPVFYADDCWFGYSTGSNGFASLGAYTILNNCKAMYNYLDGFNYHVGNSVDCTAYEVDCTAFANGLTHPSTSTHNASTTHEDSRIVRVNGTYKNTKGPIIADTDTSQAWLLGCAMEDSQGTAGNNYNCGGYKTWLDTCTFSGSTGDIVVYGGGAIYTRNTEPREETDTPY